MTKTSFQFATSAQHLLAMGLAGVVTLAMLSGVGGLATHYQDEAAFAASRSTPASQQVVVVGQRAQKG